MLLAITVARGTFERSGVRSVFTNKPINARLPLRHLRHCHDPRLAVAAFVRINFTWPFKFPREFMVMKIRRLLIAVTAFSIALTSMVAQTAQAKTETRSLTIALMGDSYTAGNGAGIYEQPEESKRSWYNWGRNYSRWLGSQGVATATYNLAWTGNETEQVVGQVDNILGDTDLIMMTAGGNDVKFPDIVSNCYFWSSATKCAASLDLAQSLLYSKAIPGIRSILQKIEDRQDKGEISLGAQVVLVGYPLISQDVPFELTHCQAFLSGYCIRPETIDVTQRVREIGILAEALQRKLVSQWNASHNLGVTYVGLTGAFAGHEPDPRRGKNPARWLNEFWETEGDAVGGGPTNGVFSGDQRDFYHPNKVGHRKIAEEIARVVGIPGSASVPVPTGENIDVAFVVDTTGSMWDDIDSVKSQITQIVGEVSSNSGSARFALVSYRDHPESTGDSSDYSARVDQAFTSDVSLIDSAAQALTANGGGDWPETVYSGLMAAIGMDWRIGVKKVAVIIGDAPAKDPEPLTGYTAVQVSQAAYAVDPVEVYAVDTSGGLASAEVQSLVDASGGQTYSPGSVSDIPAAIVDAISDSLGKPFAWLTSLPVSAIGDEITFDASGSYAIGTSLTKFEWDFDGDGTFESETAGSSTSHIYDAEFDGVVGVRVTDSGGLQGVGSTPLLVTPDGDTVPSSFDNCPTAKNPAQSDYDGDGVGDECDEVTEFPSDGSADEPLQLFDRVEVSGSGKLRGAYGLKVSLNLKSNTDGARGNAKVTSSREQVTLSSISSMLRLAKGVQISGQGVSRNGELRYMGVTLSRDNRRGGYRIELVVLDKDLKVLWQVTGRLDRDNFSIR